MNNENLTEKDKFYRTLRHFLYFIMGIAVGIIILSVLSFLFTIYSFGN